MTFSRCEATIRLDQAGERIDRIVQSMLGGDVSRSHVQGMIDEDCVSVNGRVCRSAEERVESGQRVSIEFEAQRRYRPRPRAHSEVGFRVMYEDEHLLVVEKSASLLTVPTDKHERNTLVHRLAMHVNKGRGGGRTRGKGLRRVEVIHRLDRGVSGVLVFGKYHQAAEAVREQFEARKPAREYIGIVAGVVTDDSGTFRTYLATAENLDQRSVRDPREGKLAVTHYRVIRRLRDATVVSIRLETGRRNQIRVHFSEAGHPVLGDQRYGPRAALSHRLWPHRRLALHARTLSFRHPVTDRTMTFESPVPGAMRALMGGAQELEGAVRKSSDPSR